MKWTRQQVDDRIAQWNADIRIATQNILELMEDLSYRRLSGDGGLGGLAIEGVTKDRVTPVVEALEEMWATLPLLTKVIDEANEKYKKLPWFKDAEPLAKIQEMLEGESIVITTRTTYAQRGLLTPDEVTQRLKPERVLEAMVEAYARAKAIVVEVGDVIVRLQPELDAATKDLAMLAAELPGKDVERLKSKLDEISRKFACDPLGLGDTFLRDIGPAIAKAKAGIEEAKRERAIADQRIAELEQLFVAAQAAEAEHRDKFQAATPPLFGREVVDHLVAWLARLRGATGQAAKIGFANWRTQLEARAAACQQVIGQHRAAMDKRHELRGLLDGLKAKADATGKSEQPRASELFKKAYASLYTRPTVLAVAEKLVAEYLAAVR